MRETGTPRAGDSSAERFRKPFGRDRRPRPASFNEFQIAIKDAETKNLTPRELKDNANVVTNWINNNTIALGLSKGEKDNLSRLQQTVHDAFKQYKYARFRWNDSSTAAQNVGKTTQDYLKFVREIEHRRPVERFYLAKGIRPLTREEIQEKNRYFEGRYKTLVRTRDDKMVISVHNKNNDIDPLDYYYLNSINLKNLEIEGLDNLAWRDEDENGPGRMKLSDIKYQALREGLRYLEKTSEPQFAKYKNLSIDDFQPDRLGGGHPIKHLDTKDTVLTLTRAYAERKQKSGEDLTQKEIEGEFFFPPDSDEFKRIIAGTVVGKEKLYFLGNYFPHLRWTGVECKVSFEDEEVEWMSYPLERM